MNKLQISEIKIIPVKPQNGLVGFTSFVINNHFLVANTAIYTSPSAKLGYRLVFPNKKLASGKIVDCFHPICRNAGDQVSAAIIKKYVEVMDNFNHVS